MNNTLTEAEKDKDTEKETAKGTDRAKEDIDSEKEDSKAKEKKQENTGVRKESDRWSTTADNTTTGTIPGKTLAEDRNEEEKSHGREKTTSGGGDKVGNVGPDNGLDTDENKEADVVKPGKKDDRQSSKSETATTDVVVIKDKGQGEKERKEEQVNGKEDSAKVGPNDTKLRTVVSEDINSVGISEQEMAKNNTVTDDLNDLSKNNTTALPERKGIPSRVNITQFTRYRAGGEESGMPKESPTIKEDKAETSPTQKPKEPHTDRKAKEKEKDINQSVIGKKEC